MSGDASTPGYLNGDGFGLGWYSSNRQDVVPCVYRQARPAWNDPNLGSIAEKVYTPVLFAHVRAASPGLDVSETTCHPFRYGRYLWMHNGGVGNFTNVRRVLLAGLKDSAFDFAVSHGSSDTALCFAVFMNLIDDNMAQESPENLRSCLEQTINILEKALREVNSTETSLLNFVVSDGETIAASRYVINLQDDKARAASLYYASGNSYESDGSAPGNYAMTHTDRRPSLAIISSEPLTERRADWVSVPKNSCIVITKSMHILVSPIHSSPDPRISRIFASLGEVKTLERENSMRSISSKPMERQMHPKRGDLGREFAPTSGNSNAAGLAIRSKITIPGRTVLCCAVLDSLLCSGTDDGTIHVWNIEDSLPRQVLQQSRRPVMAMLADSDIGVLISATAASSVTVYRLTPEKVLEPFFVTCCRGKGDILSLARIGKRIFAGFSDTKVRCVIEDIFTVTENYASGRLSSGLDSDGSSSGIEIAAGLPSFDFPKRSSADSHYGYVFALAPCLDGRFLCTGCGDGLLRVWNVETEKCIQRRDDHAGAILALVTYEVEYGTMLFTGSRDHSVKVWVWDGDNGFICKRTLRKHRDEVVFLTIFDDKLVSGSADGTVCVWSAESLRLLCQYVDNTLKAGSVSVRYNLLFTASNEGAIHVRDMLSTESELGLRNHEVRGAPIGVHISGVSTMSLSSIGNQSSDLEARSTSSTWEEHRMRSKAEKVGTADSIVTEVHEDTDDAETLVPGVMNEMVLAPPMSPISRNVENREALRSIFGKDGNIKTMEPIEKLPAGGRKAVSEVGTTLFQVHALERRLMQDVLARFVSFASVSGVEECREECWRAARYIGTFLDHLGASVKYVNPTGTKSKCDPADSFGVGSSTEDSPSCVNPIVLARFESSNPSARTVAFYGHYDVMPVDVNKWDTHPWKLTSVNGYFYGRGATDNKGPIIAMVFAIKKLLDEKRDGLGSNLVLILQGEGEQSNWGFKECVESHRHWFDNTALILTSNSYWLGEEKPCLTYGFRGIIDLRVSVTGGSHNLHSGVDGGAIFEPINDLITVLGTMVDASGVVCIPGFYDEIRSLTETEKKLITSVDFSTTQYRAATGVGRFTSENASDLLEARWRMPSISITSIETSNESNFSSIIPKQAKAKVSIRFVPDQEPCKIEKAIMTHLQFEMRKRRSPNKLEIKCMNKGDWWLGDPACAEFQIAERAVKRVWGVNPEYVCEGGSMPLFSYMAKTLQAPLVQVPLGQSSDKAHLPNERIRAVNLFRGKEVLEKIIEEFAEGDQ